MYPLRKVLMYKSDQHKVNFDRAKKKKLLKTLRKKVKTGDTWSDRNK